MKIASETVQGGSDFERKQPVRLPRGMFGGMLQRYSAPKYYAKYQSNETEEKFFVSFLITHDAGARKLPKFSEAFCGVRTKRFYDPVTDKASTLVRLYAALLNGKMSEEQIANADSDDLPDLDDLIGYPALLQLKPATKADKNGIWTNQIDTQATAFVKPDNELRRAVGEIYKIATLSYAEKSGLRYMAEPEPDYDDGFSNVTPLHENGDGFGDTFEDDIPF